MDLLQNPFWHALTTEQASLALIRGKARRFPADVIPFAAIESPGSEAASDLLALLAPGERVFVESAAALESPGLREVQSTQGVQMLFEGEPGEEAADLELLGEADIPAMLALSAAALPAFFRPRSPSLGAFYGVRAGSALAAMSGERLAVPGWREISAVCTHPEHRGRGYGAALIRRMVHFHRSRGVRSFLHVEARNPAIALYWRLGFVPARTVTLRQVERVG